MNPPEIYSPGLEGVIAGETAISTVEGGLHYRGYPVTELAERCTFDEVAYLLLHRELPTQRHGIARLDQVGGEQNLDQRQHASARVSIGDLQGELVPADARTACSVKDSILWTFY